ncbi:MAG: sugar ABC transporter permease [Chloroflexi bacterium]|nr:sugar ABC transporter permease [Chloroflexota bacterium]
MNQGTPVQRKRIRWRELVGISLSRLVLVVVCLLTIFPLLWVLTSSFNIGTSLYSSTLIPRKLTMAHYINLFRKTSFAIWMKNSAIACIGGSMLALSLTVTMAYAFSRFHFWGRRYGLLALILIQMLPSAAIIVAIFRILQALHLLNTFLGLILVYGGTTIPFNAWLMRGYFDSIPRELEESAYIDGATQWQAFVRIALPLAMPMVAVTFMFNLISFYNDYILASIVLTGKQNYTVALGLRSFQAPYAANWSLFAAASILGSIPIALIFYSLQRFLVEGLTKGALKG